MFELFELSSSQHRQVVLLLLLHRTTTTTITSKQHDFKHMSTNTRLQTHVIKHSSTNTCLQIHVFIQHTPSLSHCGFAFDCRSICSHRVNGRLRNVVREFTIFITWWLVWLTLLAGPVLFLYIYVYNMQFYFVTWYPPH